MHIGLIGGIGPAATDYYYQRLISKFAERSADLELTIVHADSTTLIRNLMADHKENQVAIYHRLTGRLLKAGADCVVVTSVAGHFCIEPFKETSPLPVIDIVEEVDRTTRARGLRRLGIMGTKPVMTSRFYGGLTQAEIVLPEGKLLDEVHNAYVAMATSGRVNEEQRSVFGRACHQFTDVEKVDAVMMAGTDLALVYQEDSISPPVLDCAAAHVDGIVAQALDRT